MGWIVNQVVSGSYVAVVVAMPSGSVQTAGVPTGGSAKTGCWGNTLAVAGVAQAPMSQVVSPVGLEGTEWGQFDWGYGTWTAVTTTTPVSGSDSGAGTEGAPTLAATVPGSDSATGSEGTPTVSVTAPGADNATGTDSGAVSATLSGSDSAAGTDTQVSIVSPVAGSDSAAGTDAGAVSATAAGSDSGLSSQAQVVTETGPGGEAGAGFDSGVVSVAASSSDSAAGTDAGTVQDISGATQVSGADSGAGTDAGVVVDVTPPAPPVVTQEPTGGVWDGEVDESDYLEHYVLGADVARATDSGVVVDLTDAPVTDPQPTVGVLPPVRVVAERPLRRVPSVVSPSVVERNASELARAHESAAVNVIADGDEEEFGELLASGVLDTLFA